MVPLRSSLPFIIVVLLVISAYAAGLGTGVVTIVGYQSETGSQYGFSSTSWFPVKLTVPVWLDAGSAVEADYEVDATNGSAVLVVGPPLLMRSSPLQRAVVYVSGKRSGSVTFISQAAGWYSLNASPSPIDGPRCPRQRGMAETMIGSSDCPTYVVSYKVTWRLTNARAAPAGTARIVIPTSAEGWSPLHISK